MLNKIQKAAIGYVGGFLLKTVKSFKLDCWAWKYNYLDRSEDEEKDFHSFNEAKEYNNSRRKLKYLNSQILNNFSKVYAYTKICVRKYPDLKHIKGRILKRCKDEINFNLISCEHLDKVQRVLLQRMVVMCIKKHCKVINDIMKGKDSRTLSPDVAEMTGPPHQGKPQQITAEV